MARVMNCYRHPDRETRVSCATCGRPICTECMRQTDVGIKCPEDAQLPRGARAGVMKRNQIIKSLLAGIAVAVVGIPVVLIILQTGFGRIILSALAGYGAGLLIHRAGGRNGGAVSMTISGIAVATPYAVLLMPVILSGAFNPLLILSPAVAVGFAIYNSR